MHNISFCLARADPECTPHHLNEGQEWRLLTIGRTASRQDKNALLVGALMELVQKAGLAHTRFADDVDDQKVRMRLVEGAIQRLQFVFTSDKGAKATAYYCIKPSSSTADRVETVDVLRLRFAFNSLFTREVRIDHALNQSMRRFADEHRVRLCQCL